jgi:CHAT domain-containing protein
MHLKLPTHSNKRRGSRFHHALLLLITLLLVSGAPAAQETKKPQEAEAMQLMTEGMRFVAEGSPASLPKAIEKFEAARLTLRALNLPVGEAVMLTMIGYAYSQLDQNQKAIEKCEESLPLFRAAGEQKGEASALLHLGLIHTKLGEMEKALDYLGKALALFHVAGERQGEAMALSVLGSLYVLLGKPQELISYYNKVLEMSRATASRESEAAALPAIASLYSLMGQNVIDQPQKAREGLEQLLSVSRSFGIPHAEALALLALGLDHSFERETPKAISYYEQALPLFRVEHDHPGEGAALFGLCMSHISARNYQKGFNYCSQALALNRAIGDRHAESLTLKQIAIGERNRGNLAASLTAIESAIANVESVRTKVVNPELRLSYFAGSQDYYEFYVDLLMRLHKQHLDGGYDGKALQASERARARSLLETLKEANADIRQGVDAALLQRERTIQNRLNARAQAQMELLLGPHSEAQATAIAKEVQTLITDLQQIETEIRQTSPHYAALMQPQPLSLKEIQTQVLDPDTMLLEYSLGEERSYLWAVTSTSINSYELAKGSDIETAARDFYKLLNARNMDVKSETDEQRALRIARSDAAIPGAAAALSRLVLAPVAGQLGSKRLGIIADGALHFVPFGALPAPGDMAASTGRPRLTGSPRLLIMDHEIVNLPSASTLAVIRGEVGGRAMAPKSVAVLADPVFMKDDERVKKTGDKNSKNAEASAPTRSEGITDRQLIKATEETGVAKERFYVPRLPGTRREGEQIVGMVSTVDGRLVLDFAANRESATGAQLSQYRYVHFATHGLLNSVHPELSGLVFSLVNERGEPQEGFLLAHEIFNLKLPAELVVLSACETGIGTEIKGEGLVSLTRGFMYAGAPRVLVSLWGVSDLGTTELMVRFYQGMFKQGMPPAAALRSAQLSLMNEKRWTSPYYWAPFTLQGDWR